MSKELNVAADSKPVSHAQQSIRQLMESVMDLLSREDALDGQLGESLRELNAALDQRISAPETVATFEDAVERAPWLTAEGERLRQEQTALRQSLQAIVVCSRSSGGAVESKKRLIQQMADLAELFVEYDVAEQNFFQAAFPGPEWVTQSQTVEF
jgi:hypothetical protein